MRHTRFCVPINIYNTGAVLSAHKNHQQTWCRHLNTHTKKYWSRHMYVAPNQLFPVSFLWAIVIRHSSRSRHRSCSFFAGNKEHSYTNFLVVHSSTTSILSMVSSSEQDFLPLYPAMLSCFSLRHHFWDAKIAANIDDELSPSCTY